MINGSPHRMGNTALALQALQENSKQPMKLNCCNPILWQLPLALPVMNVKKMADIVYKKTIPIPCCKKLVTLTALYSVLLSFG